jgi:hypothetical protein
MDVPEVAQLKALAAEFRARARAATDPPVARILREIARDFDEEARIAAAKQRRKRANRDGRPTVFGTWRWPQCPLFER